MSSTYVNIFHSLEGSHLSITHVAATLFVLFLASKALSYRRGLQAVSYLPGFRVPFHPFSLPGILTPTMWWNPGFYFLWSWRDSLYTRFGNDTISLVPFFFGPPTFYTSNLDIVRQVAASSGGKSFIKPKSASQSLLPWGMNLAAADGDVWRKHRRIMGPAFNNKLYESVWAETLDTYHEMVAEEGWTNKDRISVSAVQNLTFKLALLIIGKCGFGFSFTWSEPARTSDGRMSVQEALRIVGDTFMIVTFVPKWVQRLPFEKMKECFEAQTELRGFMREQVAERKADIRARGSAEASDAFSMLVKASEDEEGKYRLDDTELIGNVYIMLFAGHETTAHSIASTLGFLSVSDKLQEEIYQQIISVVGYERDPVYDDYPKLNKVLAAFFEALRMFPPGYIMIREAFEDTILQIPNPVGEEGSKTVPVPRGTQVLVDMIGTQHNPRYFENPTEYRPSRWYDVAVESEAFSAFSIGPRTCIGRKFATTEAVCFLTALLRDYKVEPTLRAKETRAEWRARVLDARLMLTLGVKEVPVTFVRRQK
ncbi:hypothetical protein HYPSUDRAFT_68834 [Hypholoma sublateritium FD-334 SS-4]|uniref:Cytochrome P450 n=1 Tax=Hypholoma sublateritium (strain FD-334 SS-4) TaxID=945553 RepID=A0A0D2NU14_HYPSF|nr:hypothetical protein HYPSUDRAFT_68834 [Hypholoma sublateritium FD-334 SS-4]